MNAQVSRRAVLRGSVAGTAVAALSARAQAAPTGSGDVPSPLIFHSPAFEPFCDDLPVLPTVSGSAVALSAVTSTHTFHRDGGPSGALAYRSGAAGGDYLGPTVQVHADEPMTLTFENDLDGHPLAADMDMTLHGMRGDYRAAPPTSLHLHGGVTSPGSDGHPELLVMPGSAAMHHFPNGQEAAHLWYHDHAMGITRLNVYAGLAGNYLIRDEFDTGRSDNPLGLPAEEFEIPLVLQEKIFTPAGAQSGRSTFLIPEGSWEGGAVGDVGLVNGKVWPELAVARGLYRFRVVNASSASVWNLHFSNMMTFWVIGNDAGMLDAPVPVTAFRCAPGERYDLLVDFTGLPEGASVELRNDEVPPLPAVVVGEVAMPLFCRFRGDSRRGFTGGVPTQLRGGRRQRAALAPMASPSVVRTVTVSQQLELRNPPALMTLNNLLFSTTDVEKPRQGTVEQWNIVNTTTDPHPIHLHLVNFRILGRTPMRTLDYLFHHPQPPIGTKWTPSPDGFEAGPMVRPAPWEAGMKDTVRVDGGTVTRIIVRFPTADELGFDPDAMFDRLPAASAGHGHGGTGHSGAAESDRLQGYVWHCHLLDHEDHDMMLPYRIVE